MSQLVTLADGRLDGRDREAGLGTSVAGVGDVDGDGLVDLAAGVPGDRTNGARAGAVLLFLSDGAPASLSRPPVRIVGAGAGDNAGTLVASAGDVDGDGYGDLLVGGAPAARGPFRSGVVWVVRGGPSLPWMIPLASQPALTGVAAGDGFGAAAVGVGDVNDDGYGDVVVGAPTADAGGVDSGAVYLFHGPFPAARGAAQADASWAGEEANDRAGASVAAVDGGFVVGAPQWGPGLAADGAVYLLGEATGAAGLGSAAVIWQGSGNERFGWSVAGAGDTDGDDEPELWVGARQWSSSRRGAAYLVPLHPAPGRRAAASLALATFRGRDGSDRLGTSVAGGADLDADGLADAILGADGADGDVAQTGAVWTLLAPFAGEITLRPLRGRHAGEVGGALTGASVASAGDVDGDGFPDVLIGSPGASPAGVSRAGAVSLLRGGADRLDLVSFWPDADGDGWGGLPELRACTLPPGYVEQPGDCDDGSAAHHPHAVELSCTDGEDYSCDGVSGAVDNDLDGALACEGDCDDTDPAVGPSADERCGNGIDDDCDGLTDDPTAVDALSWRADADQDGYGSDNFIRRGCAPPSLFLTPPVSVGGDCDDRRADVSPAAVERCNTRDDDCDGAIDEGAAEGSTEWFADADADGYGDRRSVARGCTAPVGYTADTRDCDDTRASVHPGADETCDALDNDCDGAGYLGGPVAASDALWTVAGGASGRLGAAMARVPGGAGAGVDTLAVSMPDQDNGVVLVLAAPLSSGAWGTDPAGALPASEVALRLTGSRARTGFGASLAAGDFDGDGLVDLAVGAPNEAGPAVNQGAVRVFYGPLTGARTAADAGGVIRGVDGDDRAGATLAAADLDGDGDAELIIGAPGADTAADHGGAVVVVAGGTPRATLAAGPSLSAFPALSGPGVRDELGTSLAVIGDADGDGRPELAAGAPMGGADDAGYVRVASFSAGVVTAAVRVDGASATQRLGRAIAGGDTDGDGVVELVVSAALGRVWVVPLDGSGVAATLATTELVGPAGDDLGAALATWDADQDGRADLLVGAPGRDDPGSGAGALLVVYASELGGVVDVTTLESRGRVDAGTTFPTFSAANAGVPEGASVLGPAAGAALGAVIVPGLRGLDPLHPEIAVSAPLASTRAGLVVGVATGPYGLDVAGDGDGALIAATGVQFWPDRDLDGQAAAGDPGAFVCEMHAPQTFNAPGDAHPAWVAYGALAVDCDDTDASIRRGAPDRPRDGVDSNCDGADAAVVDFAPIALRCAVSRATGEPVTSLDRVETADALTVAALGVDPEGLPVTWSYAWSDPGAGELATTQAVGAGVVYRDRVLTASCTPSDGARVGSSLASAAVPVHNAAPRIASCGLTPTQPTTSAWIVANPVVTDAEGDPVTLSTSWTLRGAAVAGETGLSLSPAYTVKGDDVVATCRATDGRDAATPLASAVTRVVNEAPVLTSVTLTASTGVAYERSTLTCAASATDADGDSLTFTWSWRVNNRAVPGANTPTLTGASFGRDDRVTCSAVPRDGLLAGASGASSALVVQNTPPVLSSASVATLDGGPVTELASLRCAIAGLADDDGDTLATTTTWSVNGLPVVTQDQINGFWYSRDDRISCAVTPNDDRDAGPTATSAAVVVENSPATAPDAVITPVVADSTDALVCGVTLGSVDPDDHDVLVYTATWWRDDVLWTGAVGTTHFAGDTIPAGLAATGLWTCTIAVDDGADVVESDPTDRHVFTAWNRRQVRVGTSHVCYVLSDSTLRCQGQGTHGQLGTDLTGLGVNLGDAAGEVGASQARVSLPAGLGVELLALGGRHTCIVGTDGEVRCWGANDRGQLGLGHTDTIGDSMVEMGAALDAVVLPAHSGVAQIEAAGDNTCVRTATGEVYCWGANTQGQCGQGHQADIGVSLGQISALAPVSLGGRAATDITVGGDFVCALLDDATVRCWGKNGLGQLGQGATANRGDDPGEMGSLATTQLGTGTVVDIDAGNLHACARFSDGRVKCWGQNSDGQLGLGLTGARGDGPNEMGNNLPAVSLGTGLLASDVAAGSSNTCVMFTNGTWKCWGSNAGGANANNIVLGAWGDSTAEMGDTLSARSLPSGAVAWQVELGYQGGCAVSTCGTLHCWGENSAGQAGVGTSTAQRTPSAAIGLPVGLTVTHGGTCP